MESAAVPTLRREANHRAAAEEPTTAQQPPTGTLKPDLAKTKRVNREEKKKQKKKRKKRKKYIYLRLKPRS